MASVNEILGPSVGYTDLIDYEISEKIKADEEKKKEGGFNPLRPSSAGYCARRLAYELMEHRGYASYKKPPQEPTTYRLLELGRSIEYHVLGYFRLLKVVQQKYKQQTLSFFEIERANLDSVLIEGSCDFVLWSDKHRAIGDIKSKKDKFSQAFKTNWDEDLAKFSQMESLVKISDTAFYADNLEKFVAELGDDFFTDNFYQLNMYATNAFMVERKISHGFIYRYNKNDSRHLEIRFRPSTKLAKKVEDKFKAVSVAVDEKKPDNVERNYVLGSIRCAFCPFQGECWGGADTLASWLSSLPSKDWPINILELPNGKALSKKFVKYEKLLGGEKEKEKLELSLVGELEKRRIAKVRLENKNVYELKFLRSPRPHFELRKGKA